MTTRHAVNLAMLSTWQLGDRKSHNRMVLSREPDKNVSSTGDIHSVTTLQTNVITIQFRALHV